MNERRKPANALLRRLTDLAKARPAGWRQPPWTATDRLIIRFLAWRQHGPEGRGLHLIWN